MKQLFCPWRESYTTKSTDIIHDQGVKEECVFCVQPQSGDDDRYFIIARYDHCYIMLNRYPYNAGHLLIIPYDHISYLHTYSAAVQTEMMHLCAKSSSILQSELKAEGINIGMNMGKAAGAGIPTHVHMHVLPRWNGDTNFFPTLCDTKQISFDLKELYIKLKPLFM